MTKVPGFDTTSFGALDKTRDVYRRGAGPAVIVMAEVPGITPLVAKFASRVADAGFTVFMPQLFGTPNRMESFGYAMGVIARVCISREFKVLAAHEKIDKQGARILGLRFKGDPMCKAARFEHLRAEFGAAFESIELEDESANPKGSPPPHSVLTRHLDNVELVDSEGEPTRVALDRTLAFLCAQLR